MDHNSADIELMTFLRKIVLSTNTPQDLKENALDILLRQSDAVVQMTPEICILKTTHAYIVASLADGKKIKAIKQLRVATGLNLLEAKKIIDEVEKEIPKNEPEFTVKLKGKED